MSDEKNLTQSTNIYKFPTISHFQKIIDPIINTTPVVKSVGPVPPQIPNYLVEIESKTNPFLDIKTKRIKDLKSIEKNQKDFDKNMIKDFKVYEQVSRFERMKFNANFNFKRFKFNLDLKDFLSKRGKEIISPHKLEIPRKTFISNTEFILDKRQICLIDLEIGIKEDQCAKLDEIIKEEEEFIRAEHLRLQKVNESHDKYLKIICQNTSDAIKLSETEMSKKNKIAAEVKRAKYSLAHLNAECIKLEEEYLKLKTYKEFLRNCHKQLERKQVLERNSLMDELKMDAMLNEVEIEAINVSKKIFEVQGDDRFRLSERNLSNSRLFESRFNFIDNQNSTEFRNVNEPQTMLFNLDQLEKLKTLIVSGFSNNNEEEYAEIAQVLNANNNLAFPTDENKDLDESDLHEDDLFFSHPEELINVLTDLEANNLSLIENVQEQEEMCDHMKQRIEGIKTDVNNQIRSIDKHISLTKEKISNLEDSIAYINQTKSFLDSFNEMERYKKLFYFGDLNVNSPDEMMDYLYELISSLYHSVFEKVDTSKSNTIDMLKRIEILIDSIYIEILSHNRPVIIKARKQVDEHKRQAVRLHQKQYCKDAEQLKIRKAMENALMPPRYKYGRKVLFRSEPLKEIVKIERIDSEIIRNQDENEFFFNL